MYFSYSNFISANFKLNFSSNKNNKNGKPL
ncbi:hypothetical protein THDSLph1_CDS0029 [Terrisporobacter phage TPDSL_ph1]